jgi:uncharacterized protein YwqG
MKRFALFPRELETFRMPPSGGPGPPDPRPSLEHRIMKAEEMLRTLEPWLSRVRRPAWKPEVEEGVGPAAASKFGGAPWIGPGADRPECGHCRRPLALLLQLDLDDLPEGIGGRFGSGLLQLFYCVREDCHGEGGWEPFSDIVSRVRVVQPDLGGAPPAAPSGPPQLIEKAIVGWAAIEDLPTPAEHEECGLKYTYDFGAGTLRIECPEVGLDQTQPMSECAAEALAIAEQGDKLAGWPAWVQGVEYPECPSCGRRMELVFQVDSEDNVPFMLGDAGTGHVTQCPDHKDVVAFGWACS